MIFSAESRYNQWVREHYRFLLRSAWALTGSRDTAEDVVQDCFTSAWRFRHQLRDQSMAKDWKIQIGERQVPIRQTVGGIVHWATKIGDVAIQFSPSPGAGAWAVAKSILQVGY